MVDIPPYPVWNGPWPPDPSWDAPLVPPAPAFVGPDGAPPPVAAPPPSESPVPPEALGLPVPPPAPAKPPDAADITIEPNTPAPHPLAAAPAAPDWSGLEQPDAISGGATPALGGRTPLDPYASGAVPLGAAAPGLGIPQDRDRETVLAGMDPVKLAQTQYLHDKAAEDKAAGDRAVAAAEYRRQAEGAEADRVAASAKTESDLKAIGAEAERLSNEKVDPDGWRSSRSLGQTISMFISGIVGGLVQSRQGGPNPGLAMIENAINRHIDAQKANLAHRRALLGDRRQSVLDLAAQQEKDYRDAAAFSMAQYQNAIGDIEAKKLQFDPSGSTALKLETLKRDIQAKQAAAARALYAERLKQNLDIAKDAREAQQLASTIRHQRAEEGLAAANASRAQRNADREFAYRAGQDAFKNAKDIAALTGRGDPAQQAADLHREQDVANRTIFNPVAKGDGKGTIDRVLRNEDGTPLMVGEKEAPVLKSQLGAMATLSKLVAQQKELIDKNGGELNPRSDAAKLAKSNAATIANLLRDGYKMGTLDEGAMKVAEAVQGGDPTAFVGDASVGLEQMLKQAEIKIDSDLKAAGWRPAEGTYFTLPRYEAPAAKRDPDYAAAIGESDVRVAPLTDLDAVRHNFDQVLGREMTPKQAAGIQALVERAATDPEALKQLSGVAENADNPAARAAAQRALTDLTAGASLDEANRGR